MGGRGMGREGRRLGMYSYLLGKATRVMCCCVIRCCFRRKKAGARFTRVGIAMAGGEGEIAKDKSGTDGWIILLGR